jgi:predicted GNAT family acetyltransferase
MPESVLRGIVVPADFGGSTFRAYVGYTNGQPVSVGESVRVGRTIGVYSVGTLAEARGRGYGSAMSRRIVADGADAGCDVAVLQSSAMGYPIYQRLGFRTVVEYRAFVAVP